MGSMDTAICNKSVNCYYKSVIKKRLTLAHKRVLFCIIMLAIKKVEENECLTKEIPGSTCCTYAMKPALP